MIIPIVLPETLVGERVYVMANNYYQFEMFRQKFRALDPKYLISNDRLQGLGDCAVIVLEGYEGNRVYDNIFMLHLLYRKIFKVYLYSIGDWLNYEAGDLSRLPNRNTNTKR